MKPLPIRIRLTSWYLAVIFASLVSCCAVMYFGLRRAIEDTVDDQLRARSDNIAQFLKTNLPQSSIAPPKLLPSAGDVVPGDQLYQVTDGVDTMMYQSAAMRDLYVPLDTTRLHHRYRHRRDDGDFTTYYHRQGDVRVLASTVQIGTHAYHVQVARVVSPLYEVLQTFQTWVWAGLPLTLCAAGLGGYWLSGRAMKPIHDLVVSTRSISERTLSKRLDLPAAHDELHELTGTMNAMLERLEAAFARITRFTSDASHELRTPVTVIRTTAEVILERERSPQQYQEMVGQILRESESTSELIEQLLTLARADADTAQLSFARVDLCKLVDELDTVSRILAETYTIRWLSEAPTKPVVVLGDRALLRRLLLILIENSCRYTEMGGAIRLVLTVQDEDAIMEVTDTGIGIPPPELNHIFERFYRASNARFFHPEGTGLGLAIAQWIAISHDSSLSVRSTVGSGTSISLKLRTATMPESTAG